MLWGLCCFQWWWCWNRRRWAQCRTVIINSSCPVFATNHVGNLIHDSRHFLSKNARHQVFITFYTQQVTWLLVTEVRSESFRLVTERRHYDAHPIYASFSYVANVIFFIDKCGIVCFLCATWVFEVPASCSSLGHLCTKFCCFCGLHCWASPWRKLHTQSITHPVTHQAHLMPWEPKLLLQNN